MFKHLVIYILDVDLLLNALPIAVDQPHTDDQMEESLHQIPIRHRQEPCDSCCMTCFILSHEKWQHITDSFGEVRTHLFSAVIHLQVLSV